MDVGLLSAALGRRIALWRRGRLGVAPDSYMGDDPETVKRGLRTAFLKHLRVHAFDQLLFAHGPPLVDGAQATLEQFFDRIDG